MTINFQNGIWNRAWLFAGILLVSACQSPQIPDWLQGNAAEPATVNPQPTDKPRTLNKKPAAETTPPQRVPAYRQAARTLPKPEPKTKPAQPVPANPIAGSSVYGPPGVSPSFDQKVPTGDTSAIPSENNEQLPKPPSFLKYLTAAPKPDTLDDEAAANALSVPPPATENTVRVAIMLPLTGPKAGVGKVLLNAAEMALFHFADENFEILVVDTKGTPDGAAKAARRAITDGARIILGPLLFRSVEAVAPQTRAAGVPVIAFSNVRSVAGDGVYIMGFLPGEQIERVIGYAFQQGITRYAALAPDNEYGRSVIATMKQAVSRRGGEITDIEIYDPRAQDFTDVVRTLADYDNRRAQLLAERKILKQSDDELSKRALKRLEKLQTLGDLPFQALLVADWGKRLQSVAALLPFYDIDPGRIRILGTGQWDVPGLGSEPALVGGWLAAPSPVARRAFQTDYQNTFAVKPPRIATLAYDAVALAAVLAKSEGGPDFSKTAIMSPSGFWGRDGIFRFTEGGYAERGLAVLQVRRRDFRVVSPAPETFEKPIN